VRSGSGAIALTRLARHEHAGEWRIGESDDPDPPAVYARIETTSDRTAPLYCDWEPEGSAAVEAARGYVPTWAVGCDISGRIPGHADIRELTLELLRDGGVAVDDYSDHPWTTEEIAEDRIVDGRRFFVADVVV
jgi:hypothetical protein